VNLTRIQIYGVVDRHKVIVAYALIDREDAALVLPYRWHLKQGYAHTWIIDKEQTKTLAMHRLILGLDAGDSRQGDHVNRNKLDNRRDNLRIVNNHAEQNQNLSSHKDSTSKHRGVCWNEQRQKWEVYVCVNGKRKNLGRYDDEAEAGRVASEYRRQVMPFATN
jgi:hypothetical protein